MKILPHRYPFLLVDRVVERTLSSGKNRVGSTIRAIKNVSINEPFFNGHFPGRPIMPGVLIIEALAQAGGLSCFRPEDPPMDMTIGSVKETRFRKPVVPGDVLELCCEVKKDRGNMVLISGRAEVGGEIVAESEILAWFTPREQ
ncbi:MAG: 3-hydroxyacyl-ACP dehydratase FabZ [Pseudobdellovibrionaceae bacterium]|nr:3-hydroxyacyl-ACP dehydratase FabZ [Bdellovibrionales bacterium]USN48976.1 MAG: 3-hydroxyacyl-ACP dehydratase FabZ [Pseudobdellovibrionaceae bacterium]